MPGFMLAHGGDASGLGMLAFLPIAILLGIGILIALRPTMTGTGSTDAADDDTAQDLEREWEEWDRKSDEGRG